MKKLIYAIIATCIGTLILGLNTKQTTPIPEITLQTTQEAPVSTIVPKPVPEPIPTIETIVEAPSEPMTQISNQNSRCGDNDYAHAIYMGESTCVMDVVNSIGACGLGQSLPCSKLENDCPDWRTNYDCQNAWFTAYAMSYGSWENAYNFKFCVGSCYSTRTKTTEYKTALNKWW